MSTLVYEKMKTEKRILERGTTLSKKFWGIIYGRRLRQEMLAVVVYS